MRHIQYNRRWLQWTHRRFNVCIFFQFFHPFRPFSNQLFSVRVSRATVSMWRQQYAFQSLMNSIHVLHLKTVNDMSNCFYVNFFHFQYSVSTYFFPYCVWPNVIAITEIFWWIIMSNRNKRRVHALRRNFYWNQFSDVKKIQLVVQLTVSSLEFLLK